ncbi:PAS domain-containing protein [Haloarcula vallismortis]|uniref:Signal-transducing histidine kinase-like protein n=2 Tax=Haloarcula vallismortis TaxID=28442 RepID=M0IVP1_HALVA|nr:histidine kinase N-terminal 7TM domain-containing protein [Haloarcula vallismortis]EMA00917.1 signal-transducing histidine kinase-like protein [Haloarcula vallismortis ATCC 29715]SDW09643.1 PAS domain-containing protein [Haloarcula vallismortis]
MDVGIATVAILGNAGGALIGFAIAVVAARNQDVPGARQYGWLAAAGGCWCAISIWQIVVSDPAAVKTVYLLSRTAAMQVIGLWIVFALVYTGRQSWLRPSLLGPLFLVVNADVLLLLTAQAHDLIEVTAVPVTQLGTTLITIQRGQTFGILLAVTYGLLLLGYGLLVEFLFRSQNVYRRQTAAIIVGTGLPILVAVLYDFGYTPHPAIDLTPVAFSLNAVLVGWVLFNDEPLSVTTLSGDTLVDNLPDPVIALNDDCVIIDYNAAAASALEHPDPDGASLDDLVPGIIDHIERGEVFSFGDSLTYYNPQTTSLTDQFGTERGRLVVLRDVTGQQRRQDRLEALQAATQQFIEAETAEGVAEMAVEFATAVLDQNAAGVFLEDDSVLKPAVISESLENNVDEELLYGSPTDEPESKLWKTYETGEIQAVSLDRDGLEPLDNALMLPLGSHGVMAITSHDSTLATEDRRYAAILAQTTQVALDQVERERELRQSRSSVQRRREQIEFFNGVLRHSLHNAMVVIRGRAEHIREAVPRSKQRHLDSISDWCGTLTEMSETIRDINNTVTASEAERLDAVDLNATLRRSIESTRAEYDSVSVSCELDGDYSVQANELLEEVLLSILRNAVEHNDADTPQVSISVQQASDWLQVRIADDGPGMSDELKTTVFERGLSPDQTAGGFGLYFVSVMMELYSGTLWFEDNHPTGTVAVLEFQQAVTGNEAEDDRPADTGTAATETQTKSHNR